MRLLNPRSWSLIALVAWAPRVVDAAEAPAGQGGQPASASSVGLAVEASGLEVNEASVRDAILEELGLGAAPASSTAPIRVGLQVARGGQLTVTLSTSAGALSRSVAAPARADEVPEVAALLVGNLARDEAGDLLAELRATRAKTASAAPLPPEPLLPDPLPPEPGVSVEREPERRALPLDAVNLSLVYPVTLLRSTEERRLALELGLLYSRLGALSGVAFNVAGLAQVDGEASGWVLGGIGYYVGGPGEGVFMSGVFGVTRERFDGISLTTAANLHFGDLTGFALAGGINVATGVMDGAELSAGFNLAGEVAGAQVTGGLNLANGAVEGVQLAGAANIADGPVEGVQLAGALNIATDPVDGTQISGGMNLADGIQGLQLSIINIGGDVDGLQLGIVNVARDVNGVQLGLVNVARKVEGVSLGFVPYSEEGRTQAVAWYDTSQPFNIGVRFQSGVLYAMPTFGYSPSSEGYGAQVLGSGEASYSPGFSLGLRLPLNRAFADLDVNYSNPSNTLGYDEHSIDLRYRVLAGWQFTRAFGVFAGGGVRHHFRTQGPDEESVDPELSVGVQLL